MYVTQDYRFTFFSNCQIIEKIPPSDNSSYTFKRQNYFRPGGSKFWFVRLLVMASIRGGGVEGRGRGVVAECMLPGSWDAQCSERKGVRVEKLCTHHNLAVHLCMEDNVSEVTLVSTLYISIVHVNVNRLCKVVREGETRKVRNLAGVYSQASLVISLLESRLNTCIGLYGCCRVCGVT